MALRTGARFDLIRSHQAATGPLAYPSRTKFSLRPTLRFKEHSYEMRSAFVGLFEKDLDNAGNESLDWQYRLRVEELAEIARMGTSTLHHHFCELTAMSPLQYEKQLRLPGENDFVTSRARFLQVRSEPAGSGEKIR